MTGDDMMDKRQLPDQISPDSADLGSGPNIIWTESERMQQALIRAGLNSILTYPGPDVAVLEEDVRFFIKEATPGAGSIFLRDESTGALIGKEFTSKEELVADINQRLAGSGDLREKLLTAAGDFFEDRPATI